jgi:hypothetical protein
VTCPVHCAMTCARIRYLQKMICGFKIFYGDVINRQTEGLEILHVIASPTTSPTAAASVAKGRREKQKKKSDASK